MKKSMNRIVVRKTLFRSLIRFDWSTVWRILRMAF